MKAFLFFITVMSFHTYAQTRYQLADKKNVVQWRGEDILKNGHEGTIEISSGYLMLSNQNMVTKGEFELDMNTIMAIDERNGSDIKDLSTHLKSDDFFSVEKFPKSSFTITQVAPVSPLTSDQFKVKGYLSTKGIINEIQFPATITVKNNNVKVKAELKIDRMKWNITYQSKNFLSDIKDTAISDDIKIWMELNFKSH
jgi:polyisoprenoid-binding protein YceI